MRTTLTLDDDVAARLDRLRKARGLGLKQAVNEALRAGLARSEQRPPKARPFSQRTYRMKPLLPGMDDIGNLLARAEGEAWR
jgi:hypothetical protein